MTLLIASLVASAAAIAAAQTATPEWPQWRGPFNTGMASRKGAAEVGRHHQHPVEDRDCRARPLHTGRRRQSPVSDNRGADRARDAAVRAGRAGGGADAGLEHRFEVLAIDRGTGRIAWQRTATTATPHEGYHGVYGSFASNSPVTDGARVFAFFGSRGLYAYDLEGTRLWQKDFGVKMRMDMAFGEGTPLTLHDDRLLLHFDHLDSGFLVMLDPATGREIWRTKRTEPYNWAAPYVARHDGRRQIIVSGLTVRGYDFETGTPLWEAGGLGENTIPSPFSTTISSSR